MASSSNAPPPSSGQTTSRPDGTHFVRRERTWSEVSRHAGQRHRLRIGGPFTAGWLSRLCSGLAAHGLSIEQAHAWVSRDGTWVAELVYLGGAQGDDAATVPFLDFVAQGSAEVELRPRIGRAQLSRTPENGGSLLLELEAPDTIGLLGAVLGKAAKLGMHPIELHIDTREGLADDRIWLADPLGRVPGEDSERSLRDWLDGLLTA
jgi:UTP:GlnB (protein PII) uridylyltransferase